jgi:hypothetical protein
VIRASLFREAGQLGVRRNPIQLGLGQQNEERIHRIPVGFPQIAKSLLSFGASLKE